MDNYNGVTNGCFYLLGATKPIYAPEPSDVGRILQADIISDALSISLTTSGPIDPGKS